MSDKALKIEHYKRTNEQDRLIGIYDQTEPNLEPITEENIKDEVLQFTTNCPECNAPCFTNMKVTSKSIFYYIKITFNHANYRYTPLQGCCFNGY